VYSSDDPPDLIAPHFGVFLLNHHVEIQHSAAVCATVFKIEPVNQLISAFIGYSDDSTGDESSGDEWSFEADSSDSQNFDPEERYLVDRLFYERHGRFRNSDDDSNEEFYWNGNNYSD
jgi:hypothetical protein